MEFQGGLEAVGVNKYVLIHEPDSAAIAFGYFKDLNHEFDENSKVVMFVGVGFIAAQVFVIRFSKVCFLGFLYDRTNS